LTILPKSQSAIIGQWEGTSNEFPNESYTITLDTFSTNWDGETYFFQNFPNGCEDGSRLFMLYNGALIGETSHVFCEHAPDDDRWVSFFRAQLLDYNTLEIEYLSGISEQTKYSFIGKRK